MIHSELKSNGQIEVSIGAEDAEELQNEFNVIIYTLMKDVGIPAYALLSSISMMMANIECGEEDPEDESELIEGDFPVMTGPKGQEGVLIQFPGPKKK